MSVSLIAALDRRGAIGRGNAMPWHLSDDLRRFKALTLGKPVLMGRRTLDAIGKPLPGRPNLILTRNPERLPDGVEAVSSLQHAIDLAAGDELMVAGGGQVYALALAQADTLYLTHVDTEVEDADTWFPVFDLAQWQVSSRVEHASDQRHRYAFAFVDYRRRLLAASSLL